MGTLGYRKEACKNGHVSPARYASGACIQCSKDRAIQNYQKDRERRIKRAIEVARQNPDERRDFQRAFRRGTTVDEIRSVMDRANGRCEACGIEVTHASACVDHCHSTGRIRGVLCRFCNALEGMLTKKAERVAQVLAYVALAEGRLGDEVRSREHRLWHEKFGERGVEKAGG